MSLKFQPKFQRSQVVWAVSALVYYAEMRDFFLISILVTMNHVRLYNSILSRTCHEDTVQIVATFNLRHIQICRIWYLLKAYGIQIFRFGSFLLFFELLGMKLKNSWYFWYRISKSVVTVVFFETWNLVPLSINSFDRISTGSEHHQTFDVEEIGHD